MKAHRSIRRFFLPTALSVALSLSLFSYHSLAETSGVSGVGAQEIQEVTGEITGHSGTVATESAPALGATPGKAAKTKRNKSRLPKTAGTSADINAEEDALGQNVFQVLLAEIALRRGDPSLASSAYADLALRTRDPETLERTIDIAIYGRQLDVALDAARLWTEIEPESAKALHVQAGVMVLANQMDELVPTLARLLELDKERLTENLLGLNRLLAQLEDRRAALEVVDKVCRPYATMPEAHYAIAIAAASAGQDERARAEARRALELRPDWEQGALLQTQLLFRVSAQEAADFLGDFVKKHPQAHEAGIQLARLMVSEKRFDEARRQFESVLKNKPNDPEIMFGIALIALQQKDLKTADANFRHFLTIPAADKNPAFFFLGQIAEEDKRVDDALDYYAKVVSGEHFMSAQVRRAHLLARQGRIEEARAQLRNAPSLSAEERVQLTIAEAALLREVKQYRTAFEVLEAALVRQPKQVDLLYESALLLEKLDRLDLMERRLRQLIVLNPNSPLAYNALGYSLADRNLRLNEARELIEKAYKLAPNDFYILDSMGWVLFRQGDLPGALDYLEKALAKQDDPEIAAHIGEVMWAMGRRDEAKQVWQEAQKKHPDNEMLAETIKKFLP